MRVKRMAQCLARSVLPVNAGPLLINSHCRGTGWPRPKLGGRGGFPLLALGPQLVTSSPPSCARSPGQRTDEELDLIFEELLHVKAVAHLSNSVSPPTQPCPPHPQASLPCERCWARRHSPPLLPVAGKPQSNFLPPACLSESPSASLCPFLPLALSPAESQVT